MSNIVTLTMNPTLDIAYTVERLDHTRKIRAQDQSCDPGGGGINVARVVVRLGNNARVMYLAGGPIGHALDGLLDLHQLVRSKILIRGDTRVSTAILDRSSGHELRFSGPGPEVAEGEWRACLDALRTVDADYLVASGSLPPGVPEDFYAMAGTMASERGIRFILDTSGDALRAAIAGTDVFLAKPSFSEFRDLTGRDLLEPEAIADAAMEIVGSGRVKHMAVTLGARGAVYAGPSGSLCLAALQVEACSSVGSGDSFLAAMVHAAAQGHEPQDAFRFGIAAGAAAVLTPGTDLCREADVHRLYAEMRAA